MHKTFSRTPPNLVPIRRALISVSDKTGVVELARGLASLGVELISTGGTSKALADAGLRITPIEQVTGFPEMMDGRIKTLHPMVHGALLAVRDNAAHAAAMRDHGIAPIDLVCINLYPFEKTIAQPEVTLPEAIENIDIGGPAMVRSSAKNADYITVITDPTQYQSVLEQLRRHDGSSTIELRRTLAAAAFALTARYDTMIAAYLARSSSPTGAAPASARPASGDSGGDTAADALPDGILLPLNLHQSLRYGENPHQLAGLYTPGAGPAAINLGSGIPQARQIHGKELSYNNINDAAAALCLAGTLGVLGAGTAAPIAACIIKHANPCGASRAASGLDAINEAIASDPLAAYGGILAISAEVDLAAAERLCAQDVFLEVLIAPGYTADALARLTKRWANLRILEAPPAAWAPSRSIEMRSVPGGILLQDRDNRLAATAEFIHTAGPAPGKAQIDIARFLEPICRALTSNAVCIGGHSSAAASNFGMRLFGAGAGQMDRLTSCRLAVDKAGPSAKGAVAFSDAFFPFKDGPEILAAVGIGCIVHPGGSKRDQETFDLCNARGITCLTTGLRHFRH
ncbi:MAG: bifunctional phosphoribosylaminoimidazolecarboxamide formyltransferase/IMP cyclohydrolase [Phycisphaerales bacterium]|nr:bifunctional phosphoribosylaminoimidazolecarboxamide formyltransferase/IMP cyclohydrolase [Phycisphaerales bacterium]